MLDPLVKALRENGLEPDSFTVHECGTTAYRGELPPGKGAQTWLNLMKASPGFSP